MDILFKLAYDWGKDVSKLSQIQPHFSPLIMHFGLLLQLFACVRKNEKGFPSKT